MKKRIVSLLLAIMMVAGMLPTAAFAAEDTALSEITGVAITVDGVTYTEGEVIIKPDSTVTLTFLGTNLEQKNPASIIDTPSVYVMLSRIHADANGEFHCSAYPEWFDGADNYPITYTNDNWATTHESGIFVTYDTIDDTPAEVTGLAITVDGTTYTEGNVTIKPDSTVSFTVFGNNLQNGNEKAVIDTPLAYLPLYSIPLDENGEYYYPTSADVFVGSTNYPITYTNDSWETRQDSGIFVTYDDGTAAPDQPDGTTSAQITGVTVTVDGVSYAQGDVVITPDTQFLVFTATGTDFTNLTESNLLRYTQNDTDPLTWFEIDTEVNTATLNRSANVPWFVDCDHFQVQYSNDGGATMIDTGIYLTYDDGTPTEPEDTTPAEITSVSVTVDGVTYTQGDVIITPDTQSVIYTVTGNNFANLIGNNLLWYTGDNIAPLLDAYFVIDTVENTATLDLTSDLFYQLESCNNFEVQYSNDNLATLIGSGIYLTYEKPVPDSTGKIVIDIADAYSNGWNGAAIEVYKNGTLETTATNEIGKFATVELVYDSTASYEFKWVTGIVDEECAFVIYVDGESVMACEIDEAHFENGETILTLAAKGEPESPELKITRQPTNGEAKLGERFCVEVLAQGEGLTYRWYFKNANATRFSKSSVTDNTYDDVMTAARMNRQIYCVITDANGNSVTTDTVTLVAIPGEALAIVTQPSDAGAKLGEEFCVTVEAQGDDLQYRWYYRKAGTEAWKNSGVRDNTYDDVMTSARHNREVYCVITDAWGNSVTTDIATIRGITDEELAIVTQPFNEEVPLGERFNVVFEAKGDGLKYQWYFRKAGTEQWNRSAQRDNSYDDVMTAARHNRELYCVVTDAWGNTVSTDPIVVIMAQPVHTLAITAQPENASAKLGEDFCVGVEAQGDSLKYQWYYRKAGTEQWKRSGVRDNTYDDVMTAARHNREVYCVITDMWGNSVTTEIATIRGIPTAELSIVQQPTDGEAEMGELFNVEVLAQGEGLKYQWYFRNEGAARWSKSGVTDNTYDDVMTKARAGREIYCVITDAWGNTVTTETVTLIATN